VLFQTNGTASVISIYYKQIKLCTASTSFHVLPHSHGQVRVNWWGGGGEVVFLGLSRSISWKLQPPSLFVCCFLINSNQVYFRQLLQLCYNAMPKLKTNTDSNFRVVKETAILKGNITCSKQECDMVLTWFHIHNT
jgi:hypothetical protein